MFTADDTRIVAIADLRGAITRYTSHIGVSVVGAFDNTIVETAVEDTGIRTLAGDTAHILAACHIVAVVAVLHLVVRVATDQATHIVGALHHTHRAAAVCHRAVVVTHHTAVVVTSGGNLCVLHLEVLHHAFQVSEQSLVILRTLRNLQSGNRMAIAVEGTHELGITAIHNGFPTLTNIRSIRNELDRNGVTSCITIRSGSISPSIGHIAQITLPPCSTIVICRCCIVNSHVVIIARRTHIGKPNGYRGAVV